MAFADYFLPQYAKLLQCWHNKIFKVEGLLRRQVKIAAVSTPQDEKVKSQNVFRVEIIFEMVGKVQSLLYFCKGGNTLLSG